MQRIGIDCRLAGTKQGGIGRYVEELVNRLPEIAKKKAKWYLFVNKNHPFAHLANHPQIQIVTTNIRHYSWQEQLVLPFIFYRHKLNLLHVPHFNVPLFLNIPVVITIHDLLWHEKKGQNVTTLPRWQYWPKYLAYRIITNNAIINAKKIIVPSKTVANILQKRYRAISNKIVLTYEGASAVFQSTNIKSKINKNQLVYVGSLYPHKNLTIVLQAMQQNPQLTLVIATARDVFSQRFMQEVKERKLSKRVAVHHYLPDEQVARFMSNSLALIQPSTSEGFGLTGIEAMASKVPLIAADIPIFREVYQQAAIYFHPHSVVELLQAIYETKTADRSQLIATGLKVANKYSWQQMAKQTWQTYQQCLKNSLQNSKQAR